MLKTVFEGLTHFLYSWPLVADLRRLMPNSGVAHLVPEHCLLTSNSKFRHSTVHIAYSVRLVADFTQPTSISQEMVRITKKSVEIVSVTPMKNILGLREAAAEIWAISCKTHAISKSF